MRGVGHRTVFSRVPQREVEEVDDADPDAAGEAGVLPCGGVGERDLVADNRSGADGLCGRQPIDSHRSPHVAGPSVEGQRVDGAGRHPRLHQLAFDGATDSAAQTVDISFDGQIVGREHLDRDQRVAATLGVVAEHPIDVGAKPWVDSGCLGRSARLSRHSVNRAGAHKHSDQQHRTHGWSFHRRLIFACLVVADLVAGRISAAVERRSTSAHRPER